MNNNKLPALDFLKGQIHSRSRYSSMNGIQAIKENTRRLMGDYIIQDFNHSLIGFGLNQRGEIEIDLDCECIHHEGACSSFHHAICQEFGLDSYEVNIRRSAKPKAQFLMVEAGSRVGHINVAKRGSYGTVGGFLLSGQSGKSNQLFSNNHVLANSNNAKQGDPIYDFDGHKYHKIGQLLRFVPINRLNSNLLDLAVAKIDRNVGIEVDGYLHHRIPRLGERVYKNSSGTTGYREGIVTSVDYTTKVNYGSFDAVFHNQVRITGDNGFFSEGGDSGSLIYSYNDDAFVGLLFAGQDENTYANHSHYVLRQFKKWRYT